ncbi:MAG: DUF373 family protein [Haloarculaceae archaeon]
MSTLVVCLDRGSPVTPERQLPVAGREAVESLVTDLGIEDPEDSRINCLLEALRVSRDLEADGEETIVAVVGDAGDGVAADRAVAGQTDELVEEYDPDSAVVVLDSAEDERLVPILESRMTVDAVDRVVVRQARDLESTYYLLKQFLADEQLRRTVLVPMGVALIAVPFLLLLSSPAFAVGAVAAAAGVFLIYKGLGVDAYLARLPGQIREALYSGQVSLVTYVVAGGLTLVGVFAGALGVRATGDASTFLAASRFVYDSAPWLTAAALAASTGRLLDELIQREGIRSAYLNLPFGVVAVALLVRGFSGYFLERGGVLGPFRIAQTEIGPLKIETLALEAGTRLALFILASIVVSLVGVRFATYVSGTSVEEELPE